MGRQFRNIVQNINIGRPCVEICNQRNSNLFFIEVTTSETKGDSGYTCATEGRMILEFVERTALALGLLIAAAGVMPAGSITWDMQGVSFSDGAVGSGYFVYEADTQTILDWSVMTSASSLFQGFSYTAATSVAATDAGGCAIDFIAVG